MATENQRKAADLISMLRSSGVTTMAEELEAIIAEAFDEGVARADGEVLRVGEYVNPYRELAR